MRRQEHGRDRDGHHHGHTHDHTHQDRDRRFARGERDLDGPHAGRRHGPRPGGGLGRFFAHGDLKLVILQMIAERPRHGYEIIKAIEDRVAGAYSPSPGVIYPTLTLLDELGYVSVTQADGGKKQHEITDQGRAFLDANRPTLDALLSRMDEAARAGAGREAPQIVRAMENLRLALRLRLSSGPLPEQAITDLAAILDRAAAEIERVPASAVAAEGHH